MELLGDHIEEINEIVNPSDNPDDEFNILGISNKIGVFENETMQGDQIKQKYKRVHSKQLVYNPHRVNVGSIGLVTEELDGGYVSNIYIVFKSKNEGMPPEYILSILKSPTYKRIIEAYDTKYGAVRANLTYEQLCKIRIPVLPDEKRKEFIFKQQQLESLNKELQKSRSALNRYVKELTTED
jgi:type I restriction enzyme S subunit